MLTEPDAIVERRELARRVASARIVAELAEVLGVTPVEVEHRLGSVVATLA